MTVFFGTDDHTTISSAEIMGTFTSRAKIEIHNDNLLEGDEEFVIYLTSNGISGSDIQLVVIIRDDEGVS